MRILNHVQKPRAAYKLRPRRFSVRNRRLEVPQTVRGMYGRACATTCHSVTLGKICCWKMPGDDADNGGSKVGGLLLVLPDAIADEVGFTVARDTVECAR